MKVQSKIGPMKLVEVTGNVFHSGSSHSTGFYKIDIKDNAFLCVTSLHAFVAYREEEEVLLTGNMLQKGDKFWFDASAFSADGSLVINKFKEKALSNYLIQPKIQEGIIMRDCDWADNNDNCIVKVREGEYNG